MVNKSLNSRLALIEASSTIRARRQRDTVDLAGLSPAQLVARYREVIEQGRKSPEGKALTAQLKGLSATELLRMYRDELRRGSI